MTQALANIGVPAAGIQAAANLDAKTRQVLRKAGNRGTTQNKATAVSKFFTFLAQIKLPIEHITGQDPDPNEWSEERGALHMGLLTAYCSDVTQSQQKASTCKTYASQVAKFWWSQYSTSHHKPHPRHPR